MALGAALIASFRGRINPSGAVGENCVIGAGAVVTRDVPAGVVAFGNPARVQREISDRDRIQPAQP